MSYANLAKRICLPLAMAVPLEETSGVPSASGEAVVDILARASERARDAAVEYIGIVSPEEAEHLLSATGPGRAGAKPLSVRLVDVRLRRERERTGEWPGSISIEWNSKSRSRFARDERFLAELTGRIGRDDVVIFVSRHGRRSHLAARAAAAAGYAHALSVMDGYEGMRAAAVEDAR